MNIGRNQVSRCRSRYVVGSAIEKDLPRGGRRQTIDAVEIVRLTTQTLPDNATHWSTRSMAAVSGVSEASVRRIWKANGLKPHLEKTFKVSRDPNFVEKLEDIVGL
ncbi:helix-turn-helix domain-containing protein [Salinisphaera sp. G21_0]|nr:helix-turn-helix domain-containing protein [Salinisphaera sp. G21_0]